MKVEVPSKGIPHERAQIMRDQQVHKSMIGPVRVKKDLAVQWTVTPPEVGAFKGNES